MIPKLTEVFRLNEAPGKAVKWNDFKKIEPEAASQLEKTEGAQATSTMFYPLSGGRWTRGGGHSLGSLTWDPVKRKWKEEPTNFLPGGEPDEDVGIDGDVKSSQMLNRYKPKRRWE